MSPRHSQIIQHLSWRASAWLCHQSCSSRSTLPKHFCVIKETNMEYFPLHRLPLVDPLDPMDPSILRSPASSMAEMLSKKSSVSMSARLPSCTVADVLVEYSCWVAFHFLTKWVYVWVELHKGTSVGLLLQMWFRESTQLQSSKNSVSDTPPRTTGHTTCHCTAARCHCWDPNSTS